MSKVKLWAGWTYDMKSINHIYNQESLSINSLYAWLGKRIGLSNNKMIRRISKHPYEGKNYLPKKQSLVSKL